MRLLLAFAFFLTAVGILSVWAWLQINPVFD